MADRLQKLMARAGYGSRRSCEEIIRAGRVQVNGRTATLGAKADLAADTVTVDGKKLSLDDDPFIYVALNKPKGIISSLDDELDIGRTTVRDLVDLPGHLYPVGRLDKPSEGLMLMTNDGKLAHRLTHPRYGHDKSYFVIVEGQMSANEIAQWQLGVMLDDKMTAPANVRQVYQDRHETHLRVVLREGRKRQIRRIAADLGHPVQKLVRERIGPLWLGDLPSGEWRHLTPEEVAALKTAVANQPAKPPSAKPPSNRPSRQKSRRNRKRTK